MNQQYVPIYTFAYPNGHQIAFLTLAPILAIWTAFDGDHTDDVHIVIVAKDSHLHKRAYNAEQDWYDVDQPEENQDDPIVA
jgi:hypothetical protein